MSFTVAIIGRPNVGKSTLFNRLLGKRLALVDDEPGVTRDRREGRAQLGDLTFTAIDTAGLDEAAPATLLGRMQAQEQGTPGGLLRDIRFDVYRELLAKRTQVSTHTQLYCLVLYTLENGKFKLIRGAKPDVVNDWQMEG